MKRRITLQHCARDERGSILILTALGLTLLLTAGGAAFDLGVQQLTRTKLQQATDAAAIAAATLAPVADPAITAQNRRDAAQRYFNINFPPTYLGVARPAPQITVTATRVLMAADLQVPTRILGIAGIPRLQAQGRSEVTITTPPPPQYDLVLVLDSSFSMNTLDAGAVGNLDPDPGTPCIPYLTVPGDLQAGQSACPVGGATRMNVMRGAAVALVNTMLNPNANDHQIGAVTWSDNVVATQPLSRDFNPVRSFLGRMIAYQGANSTAGLQAAETMAAGFRPGTVHAVILLTDGSNRSHPGGVIGALPIVEPTVINPASAAICERLKQNNTVVYTLAFGTDISGDIPARDFLANCASGSPANNLNQFFFIAPDATTLNAAFLSILTSIRKIRITG